MSHASTPPPAPTRLVVELGAHGLAREERLLADHAAALGLAVEPLPLKAMLRGRLVPPATDVVAGSVPFVRAALQRLDRALPPHRPYPPALAPWLYRRVWHAPALGPVLDGVEHSGQPLFIKPDGWKRFTGLVVADARPPELWGVSRRTPVWCSDPLPFASEWRAYVAHGRLLDLRFADHGGDRTATPDRGEIERAVTAFAATPGAPAACVVDFGVVAAGPHAGRTALVEANDGFSFGAYDDVSAATLWAVVSTRWPELAGRR